MKRKKQKCKNCKYFFITEKEYKTGRCHRYPPDSYAADNIFGEYASFIFVESHWWCGEWRKR
jgi:hypothetical protein